MAEPIDSPPTEEWSLLQRLTRRKIWKYPFVDKKLQFHIGILLAVIGGVNAFYFSLLFYFYSRESFLRMAQWFPEYVLTRELLDQRSLFIKTMVFVGLFEAFMILILGLFFSHRIAGPLYVISMRLKDVARGAVPTEVRLRRNDLLANVADHMNEAIGTLKVRQTELQAALQDAEEGRISDVKTRLKTLIAPRPPLGPDSTGE